MRKIPMLIASVAVLASAVGCTSSRDDAPAGPTSTAPTTTTTTTTTTTAGATTPVAPTGGTSDSTSSSKPADSNTGTSACAESQLRASIDPRRIPGNGTAGTDGRSRHGVLVNFRNTSGSTCTLTGYPGAAIEDADDNQVQQARRTTRGPLGGLPNTQETYRPVTLRPGAYAAALLEGVDRRERGAAQAGCDAKPYPRILVTPPNTTVPVPFTVGWPQCYSFDVHPVRALTSAPD